MSATVRATGVDRHPRVRRSLAALGVLVATATTVLLVGPLGLLVAVAVGAGQYLFGTAVAFALGQVVLVGLLPFDGPVTDFALAEAGLCLVLVSGLVDHAEPLRSVVATLVAGIAVGGLTWLVFRTTDSVPLTGGALVAGLALVLYAAHRYERVRLGLVERE